MRFKMSFKQKLNLLVLIASALVLLYLFSFIIDPIRSAERKSRTALLQESVINSITRIAIASNSPSSGKAALVLKEGLWKLDRGGLLLPVKQSRVKDFLNTLSQKAAYPVRAKGSSAHKDLGLTEDLASRLALYGPNSGKPLLDLFIGSPDPEGSSVYMRKDGKDEAFSGVYSFAAYLEGGEREWLDLRILPRDLRPESIQRIIVNAKNRNYAISRSASQGWILEGNPTLVLDSRKAETYAKTVAEIEGEDFAAASKGADFEQEGSITIETGTAQMFKIVVGPMQSTNLSPARLASDKPLVSDNRSFLLSSWAIQRILPELDTLKSEQK